MKKHMISNINTRQQWCHILWSNVELTSSIHSSTFLVISSLTSPLINKCVASKSSRMNFLSADFLSFKCIMNCFIGGSQVRRYPDELVTPADWFDCVDLGGIFVSHTRGCFFHYVPRGWWWNGGGKGIRQLVDRVEWSPTTPETRADAESESCERARFFRERPHHCCIIHSTKHQHHDHDLP